MVPKKHLGRPHRPRGISRGPAAARLLGLRVRISPWAWMPVFCKGWMMSLRRTNHSSRGKLQSVACLSVIPQPQHWGRPEPSRAVESLKENKKKETSRAIWQSVRTAIPAVERLDQAVSLLQIGTKVCLSERYFNPCFRF